MAIQIGLKSANYRQLQKFFLFFELVSIPEKLILDSLDKYPRSLKCSKVFAAQGFPDLCSFIAAKFQRVWVAGSSPQRTVDAWTDKIEDDESGRQADREIGRQGDRQTGR